MCLWVKTTVCDLQQEIPNYQNRLTRKFRKQLFDLIDAGAARESMLKALWTYPNHFIVIFARNDFGQTKSLYGLKCLASDDYPKLIFGSKCFRRLYDRLQAVNITTVVTLRLVSSASYNFQDSRTSVCVIYSTKIFNIFLNAHLSEYVSFPLNQPDHELSDMTMTKWDKRKKLGRQTPNNIIHQNSPE